jgi:NTE family protein
MKMKMKNRALVLGGGGAVGLAWEAGLLAGLAAQGVRVAGAEWIVGTSAGAFLGAMLASGLDPEQIITRLARAPSADEISDKASRQSAAQSPRQALPDARILAEIFSLWGQAEVLDRPVRERIALLANDAAGERVNPMLGRVEHLMESRAWPPSFEATAVSSSGEFAVFGARDGVSLDLAVAASCAVPGIFPPVEIAGVRYVDGGVRSGTSADVVLARSPSCVLIIAPLSDPNSATLGRLMDRCMRDEMQQLHDSGIPCHPIAPDADDRKAFGPNMMDPSRSDAALEAGRERAHREVAAGALGDWL